jgi:hypothetical protein
LGRVKPLGLALGRRDGGLTELIGWFPTTPAANSKCDGGVIALSGLAPGGEYEGAMHWTPSAGKKVQEVRIFADSEGCARLLVPPFECGLAFKFRLR